MSVAPGSLSLQSPLIVFPGLRTFPQGLLDKLPQSEASSAIFQSEDKAFISELASSSTSESYDASLVFVYTFSIPSAARRVSLTIVVLSSPFSEFPLLQIFS